MRCFAHTSISDDERSDGCCPRTRSNVNDISSCRAVDAVPPNGCERLDDFPPGIFSLSSAERALAARYQACKDTAASTRSRDGALPWVVSHAVSALPFSGCVDVRSKSAVSFAVVFANIIAVSATAPPCSIVVLSPISLVSLASCGVVMPGGRPTAEAHGVGHPAPLPCLRVCVLARRCSLRSGLLVGPEGFSSGAAPPRTSLSSTLSAVSAACQDAVRWRSCTLRVLRPPGLDADCSRGRSRTDTERRAADQQLPPPQMRMTQ